MSRRTLTKLGRMFIGFRDKETGMIVQEKNEMPDPATPRQAIEIEIGNGTKVTEMVAPGQIINAYKARKRYLKRVAESRKK